MSYLDTKIGSKLFNQFLKKFKGGSEKVYRSEIEQFFKFSDCGVLDVNKDLLHAYQERIAGEHSPKTTKRKFSILNSFFKFLEKRVKGFRNPISSLKEFKTHRGVESEEFKEYLKEFISLQNTYNTKRNYENLISSFFAWAGKDLFEIGKSDLLSYRDYLRENNYKDATIWNKFVALNRFFKYIERENRKFHNPIIFRDLSLIFPKKDRGYYTVLSKEEAERFLKQPDKRTEIGKRDYCIILLMLVYGLRANEAARLKYKHMESERVKGQQKVWIRDRKGRFQNRPETPIILNGRALQSLDAWLDTVKKQGIKITGETAIFLPFIYDRTLQALTIRRDRMTKPLSVKAIENLVSKYLKNAKIEREGLSPHALRHTAFTMLAQAGRPIQDIQKLAGHQDINTTMIYVHSIQSYEDHPGMYSPLNR